MKKKLCIITSSPGSIISFHKTNIDELSKIFDIYIISNFDDESIFKEIKIIKSFPVKIERHPTILGNIKALFEIYRIFKREKFDAFLSQTINASLLSALAGKISRIPVRVRIFTGQLWTTMPAHKKRFFKFLDKVTVACDTDLLVDGKSQREYLIEEGILKEGQAEVLANGSICGVEIERFKPDENTREEERNRHNISCDDVVFAFMGRINREKGIFELLEAANNLAKTCKNLKLVLIGNIENLDDEYVSKYPNLRLGENLILYGYTSEPYKALQIADVFCLPSYREGFGMSIIEAAAAGLPVIGSDAYGLRDSFVDGVTGLKCKVRDVASLQDAMLKLFESENLRKSMAREGRDRVVKLFNRPLVSKAWLEYFRRTVK